MESKFKEDQILNTILGKAYIIKVLKLKEIHYNVYFSIGMFKRLMKEEQLIDYIC